MVGKLLSIHGLSESYHFRRRLFDKLRGLTIDKGTKPILHTPGSLKPSKVGFKRLRTKLINFADGLV